MYRVYSEEHLAVRRLKRKRLVRPAPEGALLSRPNQEWAIDFVADGLATGRGLRMLTVVDSFTRECPAIEVDTGLSSRRVTRVLEWIISQRGAPEVIRCDNGPEFTSRHFLVWCEERGVTADPHSAGPTDAERACGKLQRAISRRVLESSLVHDAGGCQSKDRAMEEGIQCRTAAQQPGLSNIGRIRGNLLKAHQQDGGYCHPAWSPPVNAVGVAARYSRSRDSLTPRRMARP